MEKFNANDRRFILTCLAVLAVGAVLTGLLFHRAFPEASIDFRVNRSEARVRGEKFLKDLGRNFAGARFAGRFDVDAPSARCRRRSATTCNSAVTASSWSRMASTTVAW